MIHEVSGDILLSSAKVIAHGVAPNDHMDSGLALALRERWPAMYKDFRHFFHGHHPDVGELWTWAGADGHRIVSLFTQEPAPQGGGHPGKATLAAVGHALKQLAKVAQKEKFESIALPRLATGVGGLEWTDVKPLIQRYLGELEIPIYVYSEYHAGVRAKE